MGTTHKAPLTSTEIGLLWSQYQLDSMSVCVEKFHLAKEKDQDVQSILRETLTVLENSVRQIDNIFTQEEIPVPVGFTEKDVNLGAPPLYSDIYRIHYVKHKLNLRMVANGLACANVSRADIRKYYYDLSGAILKLDDKVTNYLLDKGIYIRPPYITTDNIREFIQSASFMGSYFGDKERKLLAAEVGTLFYNIQNNVAGKTLLIGFSQVVTDPEIREYMKRGMKIASKNIEILSSLLSDEDVPIPMSESYGVTSSTIAPFSDKLMLTHVALLNQIGIQLLGTSVASAMRKDLQVAYIRAAAEVARYASDGMQLLISNRFMEEPPHVIAHN